MGIVAFFLRAACSAWDSRKGAKRGRGERSGDGWVILLLREAQPNRPRRRRVCTLGALRSGGRLRRDAATHRHTRRSRTTPHERKRAPSETTTRAKTRLAGRTRRTTRRRAHGGASGTYSPPSPGFLSRQIFLAFANYADLYRSTYFC
jgi:hypothetical protein